MKLQAFRKSKKMRLREMAPILDISVSTLSNLENGLSAVSRETMARIDGATDSRVTASDLSAVYLIEKPFSEHRAAGRSAMQAFQKAAKKPSK